MAEVDDKNLQMLNKTGDQMKTAAPDSDVIIIGGGPAGLSACLWCFELGLKPLLIEREPDLGGQLLSIHNPITNYLGIEARDGRELRNLFVNRLGERPEACRITGEVESIDVFEKTVRIGGGRIKAALALVVATGVRRRRLGVGGEAEFVGRGILTSGAKEKKSVTGKRVVIVGGGDAAIENALILGEFASEVIVVHRRDKFRARPELMDAAKQNERISFIQNAEVRRLVGDRHLEAVEVLNRGDGRLELLDTDALLIRIGVEPNSEIVRGQVRTDAAGYIHVDSRCETSRPGIFAVGDIANPISPTITSAAGMGATAAKAIFSLLKSPL
jgi:thioredoxin reductase (NADPH)